MKCNPNGTRLEFTFDECNTEVFDTADATTLHTQAMMHGFEQKIRDNAAIARKQKDGTVITVTEQMRHDAVVEMMEQLRAGNWNVRKAAVKSLNPTWVKLAEKRGVAYDVIAAEKAAADLAELSAM